MFTTALPLPLVAAAHSALDVAQQVPAAAPDVADILTVSMVPAKPGQELRTECRCVPLRLLTGLAGAVVQLEARLGNSSH